jgi:hypothetical protein
MTVNYKIDAMLELRKYIWTKLQAANIFDPDDYYSDNIGETLVPIIPVQQIPDMNQFLSGKDHIVYDKIGVSYDTLWLICNEQILFTVYSTDVSKINEIRNFMIDEFRRMDDSAKDVNRSPGFNSEKFKFHSIYIADMSPTGPSEELQGFYTADVVLEISYSRNTDTSGRYI